MTKHTDTRSLTGRRKSKHQLAERPAAATTRRGRPIQQENGLLRAGTKQAKLVNMMRGPRGVTIAQMGAKIGWQRHSVRAALTGLRKRGLGITRDTNGAGTTVYRIVSQRKGSSS
jgi:hypothetical protein